MWRKQWQQISVTLNGACADNGAANWRSLIKAVAALSGINGGCGVWRNGCGVAMAMAWRLSVMKAKMASLNVAWHDLK